MTPVQIRAGGWGTPHDPHEIMPDSMGTIPPWIFSRVKCISQRPLSVVVTTSSHVLCCPTCTQDLRIHLTQEGETSTLSVECSCSTMPLEAFYEQVTAEDMDWGHLPEVPADEPEDADDRMFH